MQQVRAAILPHTVPDTVECSLRRTTLKVRLEFLKQVFHFLSCLLTRQRCLRRIGWGR